MYNSSAYLEEFCKRIIDSAEKICDNFEIILVDDGSPDDSLQMAMKIQDSHPEIKIIELSRNFGHHRAMMIGLKESTGERTLLIDLDLEEPPEDLIRYWEKMDNDSSIDVVYGFQSKRNTPLIRRALSSTFHKIFDSLASVNPPKGELVSRLMSRKYLENLCLYQERELFMPGIWVDNGFKQVGIETIKGHNGNSNYTLRKRFSLAVNAITSFSSKPLEYIFVFGAMVSFFSILASSFFVYQKLIHNSAPQGYSSLIVAIFLMGGLTIFSIGLVGIYISKVFTEVKSRPYGIIRETHHGKNDGKSRN